MHSVAGASALAASEGLWVAVSAQSYLTSSVTFSFSFYMILWLLIFICNRLIADVPRIDGCAELHEYLAVLG